jgi:uncharacterized membrane protein
VRAAFRWVAGLGFLVAGANHFRVPNFYLPIMPPFLPQPLLLIYISGAAEMAGGLGLLLPATRRLAAWGLILLLLAIFPANLQMALHGFAGLPGWVLWARLPFQAVFIWWVYAIGLSPAARTEGLSTSH